MTAWSCVRSPVLLLLEHTLVPCGAGRVFVWWQPLVGLVLRRLEDDSELLQCVRWGLVPSATKQRGRRCLCFWSWTGTILCKNALGVQLWVSQINNVKHWRLWARWII